MHTKHHRLDRERYQGRTCVAFTLCLEGRPQFFRSNATISVFVESLAKVAKKYDFCVVHCFMPDHLHLVLLATADDANPLRGVELFKQLTGYWLKKNHPRIKWQKSFGDRILRTNELGPAVRYVLDNPVRRGMVNDWREYPFTGSIGIDLEELVADLATNET